MQNLTLSETITELLYQTGLNPTSYPLMCNLAAMVIALQDEKQELEKQAELAEECKGALFKIINEKINAIVSSSVDYNENHEDSHGNYAELIADDYVYCNRQKELIAFCAENDIDLTAIDIEQLENSLISDYQSQKVNQYHSGTYHDKFVLARFAFTEHEIQVDFDSIGESITPEIMAYMKENNLFDACCGSLDNTSGIFYESSDNCVEFYVTLDQIKQIISDMVN
jgi:hypothetical protein